MWGMLRDLRGGVVRDLRPTRTSDPAVGVPDGSLTCLLGFGARLFDPDLHVPRLVNPDAKPWRLVALRGPGTPAFPSLPWSSEQRRKSGEADLALQFIAGTELAVNLAVVETWKLISDHNLPLEVVTFHAGFGRVDGRSWIDFHDGLNNMEAGAERRSAIEVVASDPPWMKGGTYMGFLRVEVDLMSWRRLSREHQEILVGRDKLTGCPLEKVDRAPNGDLTPVTMTGCPASGRPSPEHRNPSRPGDPLVQASHIHRTNRNRGRPDTDAQNRRQGYEFLEPTAGGQPSLGLNFVSFQRGIERLTNVLRLKDWQGDVNFGGRTQPGPHEPAQFDLLSLTSGGLYAVPPKSEPFPGADIF